MSARVEPDGWAWWCAECGDGSPTYDTEDAATQAANEHDERQHR